MRRFLSVVCAFCEEGTDHGAVCTGCIQDMRRRWFRVHRCWCCAQPLILARKVGAYPAHRRPFWLCIACRRQPRAWQRVAAVIDFEAPWSLWVHELKRRNQWQLAWPMGVLMAQAWHDLCAPKAVGPTVWVPIPARESALKERGFNPAYELARYAAREVPEAQLLRGVHWQTVAKRQQQPQKWRSRRQRRYDLQHAFRASEQVRGQAVVLVDDILTTGFTLQAAAQACLAQGARSVWAVVFARTPRASAK